MPHKGKRIYKTVTYKAVHFDKSPGKDETLATLLTKAVTQLATVGMRRRNVGSEDDPVFHVIGSPISELSGISFGALMTYTPGTDPLFLVDDAKAQDILLEKLSAPSSDGKRREFLESILFFAAYKNHIAFIQSQALKAMQLENYLLWLLHSSKALPEDVVLRLIDTPPKAAREKMEAGGGVKSIKIGGEVVPPTPITKESVVAAELRSPGSAMTISSPVAQSSTLDLDDVGMFAALKKLVDPAAMARIPFQDLAESNIEMVITLRYKRKTTEAGQKLMDSLGVAFRHAEDVETELKLKTGGSIKGSEIRLTGTIGVQSYDGQLDHSEVYQELQKWLHEKIQIGAL